MTSPFKTASAAAFAVFALASAARAQEVHIAVDGKSPTVVHAQIVDAAYTVCRETDAQSFNTASESQCVADTIDKAEADFTRLAKAPATQLARAQITGPRTGER